MFDQDRHEQAPDVENDPKNSRDQEKEITPKKERTEGAYQYTDWASI